MPQHSDLLSITTYTQEQRGEAETRKDLTRIRSRKERQKSFSIDINSFHI